jgi:hypothetical protein
MSEFTDFYALLSEAETLAQLRGGLEQSVTGAHVPFGELLDDMSDDDAFEPEALISAWAKAPKPMWIKLGLPWHSDREELADLAKLGPAFRLRGEEDFSSWGVMIHCGGHVFAGAVLLETDTYRAATEQMPLFTPDMETALITDCLGLDDAAFRAAMVPDGGDGLSALLGIKYEQMLDLTIDDPEVGEYTFGYGF